MTTALPQTEAKPILVVAFPCVFVSDIKASCAFFTEKLGFTVAFTYGDPPYFAEVVRDGARLNLRRVGAAPIDPRLRDEEELLAASFGVETDAEIKALFLEFHSAGVEFYERLAKQPWGVRAFIARDLDGNLLAFAGPPTDAA